MCAVDKNLNIDQPTTLSGKEVQSCSEEMAALFLLHTVLIGECH